MTLQDRVAKLQIEDIPELPRFINVAQAAKILNISKTSVYYKIYEQEAFDIVYRVGGGKGDEDGDRPYILLLKAEIEDYANSEPVKSLRVRVHEWNQRMKDWGRANGFTIVNDKGRPTLELVEAYMKAHPEDVRPT